MIKFDYLEPSSLDETFTLLDQHGDSARVIAGGTSLIIWMRQRLLMPKVVISVARIPNFDTITFNEHDGLCIGAGARHPAATSQNVAIDGIHFANRPYSAKSKNGRHRCLAIA